MSFEVFNMIIVGSSISNWNRTLIALREQL